VANPDGKDKLHRSGIMIFYPISIVLTLLSIFSILPGVVSEITLCVVAFFGAVNLFRQARQNPSLPWSQGIISLAFAALITSLANFFWVYGGFQEEFPAWANFLGTLLFLATYFATLYSTAQGLWNLHDDKPYMNLAFVTFITAFLVVVISFFGIERGVAVDLDAGAAFINLFLPIASATIMVLNLINLILGYNSDRRPVFVALLLAGISFFVADIVFITLPEELANPVWNICMICSIAAMHVAAYAYVHSKLPGLFNLTSNRLAPSTK
jgi:hypothetical protein